MARVHAERPRYELVTSGLDVLESYVLERKWGEPDERLAREAVRVEHGDLAGPERGTHEDLTDLPLGDLERERQSGGRKRAAERDGPDRPDRFAILQLSRQECILVHQELHEQVAF